MRGRYACTVLNAFIVFFSITTLTALMTSGLRTGLADSLDAADTGNDPAFKTIHMFNLASSADEKELIAMLEQFNERLKKLGHPESQYRLWKLSENEKGERAYLWESNWVNKKVYDQVHGDTDYKNLIKKFFMKLAVILGDHKYYKYSEIPLLKEDSL